MTEPKEYKMKSEIKDDSESQARLVLYTLLQQSILDFHLHNGDTLTVTTNPEIAGLRDSFNTDEEFYVYDINANEWTAIRYDEVESMEVAADED